MRDPYRILGVPPNIDQAALRRVFHRLAKKYHPDLHPGDPRIEAIFKEISAAYSLLSDPVRRDRYDRGDIAPSETWTAQFTDKPLDRDFFRVDDDFAQMPEMEAESDAPAEDWFSRFARPRPSHAPTRMRGSDATYVVPIGFGEAARGGRKLLRLADGSRIEFNIPPGTVHRDILKLDGKGRPGVGGAPDGDAYIEFHVAEHPRLRRDGYDVTVDVPLDEDGFRRGARVMIPTLEGERSLNIPAGEQPNAEIRVEGGGIIDPFKHRRGDLIVRLVPAAAQSLPASEPGP